MELNGLANIKLLVESLYGQLKHEHHEQTLDMIKEQLLFLERYMIQYSENAEANAQGLEYFQMAKSRQAAQWHEVLRDIVRFPTMREKLGQK